jgi:hypothetical protein
MLDRATRENSESLKTANTERWVDDGIKAKLGTNECFLKMINTEGCGMRM